jgi:hypothetical protein
MKTHIPLNVILANGMETFLGNVKRRRSRIEASRKLTVPVEQVGRLQFTIV